MDISPTPDIVTRVFMLFQGVKHEKRTEWVEAEERAELPISFWAPIVGIDEERQKNEGLFRVLEWGGMEVA